jgi:hypothetical protein
MSRTADEWAAVLYCRLRHEMKLTPKAHDIVRQLLTEAMTDAAMNMKDRCAIVAETIATPSRQQKIRQALRSLPITEPDGWDWNWPN